MTRRFGFGPVATPTVLLWGRDDPYALRLSVDTAADLMTGDILVDSAAGHWLVQECPEAVRDEISSPPRRALDLAHRLVGITCRGQGARASAMSEVRLAVAHVRPGRGSWPRVLHTSPAIAAASVPVRRRRRVALHIATAQQAAQTAPMTTHAQHNETTVTTPTTSRNRPFGRHTTPHKSVTRLPASVADVPSGAPGSVRTPADLRQRPRNDRRTAVSHPAR